MDTETAVTEELAVHIRYAGQSYDFPMGRFDVGPESNDAAIIAAVAAELSVPTTKLQDYAVDRHPNGSFTVRPEAVFG